MDITAAVAPDKLTPSLSICVVPLSPSGEERGEGGAEDSCSGKIFFCFKKKTKNKVKMFNVLSSILTLSTTSYHTIMSVCSSLLQKYHTLQRRWNPGKEAQKLLICIDSYLSEVAEDKWLKKKPTSIWEGAEKQWVFIYPFITLLHFRNHRRGVSDYFPGHILPIIWVYHNSNKLTGPCIYSHINPDSNSAVSFTAHLHFPSTCFKRAEILN